MSAVNLTDATCDFGLAQTDGGECTRNFASFDPDAYLRTQITYLAIGTASVVSTGFLYYRAVKYDAAKLQQRSLMLCVYVSLTFVFRSADPNSYRHIIPHPIVSVFSDSSTAAIYSIFILSLSYWASVIQRGAAHIQQPLDLKLMESMAVVLVWLFYLSVDMVLFLTKGFFTSTIAYVQMMGSAGVLVLIGISFFVYGARVRVRLMHYERQKLLFEQRNAPFEAMDTGGASRRSQDDSGRSHADKILKILVVVEGFVALVIGAQIFTGIMYSGGSNTESDCANGLNCDELHSSVSFMHWFQFAAVWIVVWVFRKVERHPNDSAESDY